MRLSFTRIRLPLLLLFLTCLSVQVSFSQSLSTGLVFFLPITGNANDIGPNGLHGISTGQLVPDRLGVSNSAYYFNGSGPIIQMPFSSLIQIPLPLTISFYANFQVLGNTAFANCANPSLYYGVWMGTGVDGKVHLDFGDGGTTSSGFRKSKNSTLSAGAGAWHHYVGVIRSATDMDIYIDCVNAGGVYSGSGGAMTYSAQPARMGYSSVASMPSGFIPMTGYLDEIGFWRRALSPSEVLQLCNNPVILAAEPCVLSGAWEGEDVELQWAGNTNGECRGYEVLRSENGIDFDQIAFIPSAQGGEYQFLDPTPDGQTLYYQLHTIDYNGESIGSNVVTLKAPETQSTQATAFPIPFHDHLTLKLDDKAPVLVSIWNQSGFLVHQGYTNAEGQVLELPDLASGIYFLVVGEGEIPQMIKIVKQ